MHFTSALYQAKWQTKKWHKNNRTVSVRGPQRNTTNRYKLLLSLSPNIYIYIWYPNMYMYTYTYVFNGNHVLFCHLAVKQSGFRHWRVWSFCKHPADHSHVTAPVHGQTGSFWFFQEIDWIGRRGLRCSFSPPFPQWSISCFTSQGIPGCCPEVIRWPALWPQAYQSLTYTHTRIHT